MDLRQLFATNLRRIRHARKVSQEGLANEAGVDGTYLSRAERAVTYVGLEIVVKLPRSWGRPGRIFLTVDQVRSP
jgi:transcriptional regulator with XRE-family HTH domain